MAEYYNTISDAYIHALKQSTIYPVVKVELLDPYENAIDEVTQDISRREVGNISINYQQGVRRSCSITLDNKFQKYTPSYNGVIWFNTKFRVYLGIKVYKVLPNTAYLGYDSTTDMMAYRPTEVGFDYPLAYEPDFLNAGYDTYWFSQGVFVLTNPSVLSNRSNKTITLNGVDKFGLLGSETAFHELEGTYKIPADTTLKNIIYDTLQLDSGNGVPIDPIPPYISNEKISWYNWTTGASEETPICDLTLPYDIEKTPNQYFSDIFIELGNIFACDIFYDANGVLNVTRGNIFRDMQNAESMWNYSVQGDNYFNPQLNIDFTNMFNVIKVVGTNESAKQYCEWTVKNNDYASPTRIQLIGEKYKYIESSFCYDMGRTKDFANYLLRKYSMLQETLSFESSIIPHLEVNNVINITDPSFNYLNQRFIMQSITMPLSTQSLMSIEASNTANIPYFEY